MSNENANFQLCVPFLLGTEFHKYHVIKKFFIRTSLIWRERKEEILCVDQWRILFIDQKSDVIS